MGSTIVSSDLVRDWTQRSLSALGDARGEIDALNVFPVPDGDTGTNLYLTMESAWQSVEECWSGPDDPPTADAASAMATGALLGARGNSGVILSQILRGTSEVLGTLTDGEELDGRAIQRLLSRAADLGYEAVARPVEGTILTVARAAAEAATTVVQGGTVDASTVVSAAAEGAREALARTPSMLEALALAGVVDAGGRGLVVVLDALADVVTGVATALGEPGVRVPLPRPVEAEASHHYGGPAYEVMFLLTGADDGRVTTLRQELDGIGDSLVVVGGDGLWNVHVHVDDAGAAVEAAIRAGQPYRIRITHLEPARVGGPAAARGIVAVTHGPGTAALLSEAGAGIIPAVARQRPSTAEILGAVRQIHADEVIVLPSDSDTQGVAEVAALQARESGLRVAVIPTRSIVQTLAAAAVHDPEAEFDDDVVSMTRAAGATRYAAVTIASRAALTTVGPCEAGDVLGLVDGDIAAIGSDPATVARDLLTGVLAVGGELVTIVLGSEAGADLSVELPRWLEAEYPLVDVVVHDGGQPLWPIIVGVE